MTRLIQANTMRMLTQIATLNNLGEHKSISEQHKTTMPGSCPVSHEHEFELH